MDKVLQWWEWGLILAIGLSIAFLGIGRLEFFAGGGSISAWSISRTTFGFWLAFKAVLFVRGGWAATRLSRLKTFTPLFVFFFGVTLSLVPNFRELGDYRYFFFGCAHAVMVADLLAGTAQRRWLPIACGVLPIILVLRGLIQDPSVFRLVLAHRFNFPLDHPNTAGYLFALSIPLGLSVAIARPQLWRALSGFSCVSQVGALFLTYSRGAWLGTAAALFFLMTSARKWKYLAIMAFLAGACLLVFPSIQDRLGSMRDPNKDESLRDRGHIMRSALAVGLDHPLLGVGYGRGLVKEALRPRLQNTPIKDWPALHSHNVYLELFAGTGLFGLLSFIWLLGASLLRVLANARKHHGSQRLLGFALAASWIAAIVAGIGDIPFYHHETRIFFFTLLAAHQIYYSSGGNNPAL